MSLASVQLLLGTWHGRRPDQVERDVPLTEVEVELGWGPAKLAGKWVPDIGERDAAWELYVELVSRVATVPLAPTEGSTREALSSLYSLFETTRGVLRKYGPAVARSTRSGEICFGFVAVWVLNAAVRPLLANWHRELLDWEERRGEGSLRSSTRGPGTRPGAPGRHLRAAQFASGLRSSRRAVTCVSTATGIVVHA
jgi:hypothetical protein